MEEVYVNKERSVQISQKFAFFRSKSNKCVTTNLGICFQRKKTEEKIKNGKKQIAYFSTRALDGILESEKGQEQ